MCMGPNGFDFGMARAWGLSWVQFGSCCCACLRLLVLLCHCPNGIESRPSRFWNDDHTKVAYLQTTYIVNISAAKYKSL